MPQRTPSPSHDTPALACAHLVIAPGHKRIKCKACFTSFSGCWSGSLVGWPQPQLRGHIAAPLAVTTGMPGGSQSHGGPRRHECYLAATSNSRILVASSRMSALSESKDALSMSSESRDPRAESLSSTCSSRRRAAACTGHVLCSRPNCRSSESSQVNESPGLPKMILGACPVSSMTAPETGGDGGGGDSNGGGDDSGGPGGQWGWQAGPMHAGEHSE